MLSPPFRWTSALRRSIPNLINFFGPPPFWGHFRPNISKNHPPDSNSDLCIDFASNFDDLGSIWGNNIDQKSIKRCRKCKKHPKSKNLQKLEFLFCFCKVWAYEIHSNFTTFSQHIVSKIVPKIHCVFVTILLQFEFTLGAIWGHFLLLLGDLG